MISTGRLLDGTTYTMSQTWSPLGQVLTQTFPDGETVTYGYNSATWLAGVTSPGGNYIDTITYNNARGQRYRVTHGNGVVTTHTYHATNHRETRRSAVGPGSMSHQDLTYGYDNVGNITAITDAVGTATRIFTYDALNRLTNASGTFGPLVGGLPTAANEAYTYDATGNLLTRAGTVYTYTDPAHPAAVTSTSNGWTFTYDENGNMFNGAGRASSWDADSRLTATTVQGGNTAQFAYDYTGARVRKTTSAGATRYPFSTYEIGPDATVTKYIKLGDAVYAAKKGTQQLFYHPDHLGGVHVVTDVYGARVQLAEYTPWGMVARSEGTAETTKRFTGKELDDPEVGLLYYGGRYYWAALGRFMSADPFVPAPGNPQSLNRYAYVLNNPVNFIDPSGYFWKGIGKFFSRLGDSLVKNAPMIIVGIAVGAIAVATGGFGLALTGPALAMFAGAAAGAASGAVGTAINGGDFAANIFVGAVLGAMGGAVAPGLSGALGGGLKGALGTSAILGGAFGGLSAGISGGNIHEGIAGGAITAVALTAAVYGGYRAYHALKTSYSTHATATPTAEADAPYNATARGMLAARGDIELVDPVLGPVTGDARECIPTCMTPADVMNRPTALGSYVREVAPVIIDHALGAILGLIQAMGKALPPGCCTVPDGPWNPRPVDAAPRQGP